MEWLPKVKTLKMCRVVSVSFVISTHARLENCLCL